MAHRQAPTLPQSGKGEGNMQNPQLNCGIEVVSRVKARLRIKVLVVLVSACLTTSVALNLQIRTGEGLAY